MNRDRGIFKDPPKSGVPEHMKNRSRYCQFHKDFGHDTVHCRNLYAQVMLAIQAGKLGQYVKNDETQPRPDTTRTEKGKQVQASGSGEQTLRVVPTIVGRPELTHDQEENQRCLKKAEGRAKRWKGMGHSVNNVISGEDHISAAPIVFTQHDLTTVRRPHDDPLVIRLQIGSALVGRVLVDGGSSVDILFLNTFDNMGLDRSTLRPTCQPLFGFDSTRVCPLGIVTLDVCAAERCVNVDFIVVDCQSSFNVIMGRDGSTPCMESPPPSTRSRLGRKRRSRTFWSSGGRDNLVGGSCHGAASFWLGGVDCRRPEVVRRSYKSGGRFFEEREREKMS
ncbi:hypothetical protein PanWU01x14_052480 [Parasponia andersonii]|uniref:Aspartic peptidase domain containing protein n=1 Tax=Parasponia andersonii TaxID=3476 RepID=A0A2P5DMA5_PARAD|nr:hypothetical protein PanWU01x14_052480 [Parasponia andersonii]